MGRNEVKNRANTMRFSTDAGILQMNAGLLWRTEDSDFRRSGSVKNTMSRSLIPF